MAIDWSDPSLYISGAGTGAGVLANVLPFLLGNQGGFQAKQAARQAGINQNAAETMARNKEAQAQALANKPLDPTNYYNMIGNAVFGNASNAGPGGTVGVDPIQRAFMANATTSWGDPSLAARTYTSEYLPLQASNYMNQAMGYANQDRTNQLNAIQWSPAINAMLNGLGSNTQMQYAQLLNQNQPRMQGGDVGALGAYFQNRATQQNQQQANTNAMTLAQQQMKQSQPMWDYYSGLNRQLNQGVASPGSAYTGGLSDTSSDTSIPSFQMKGGNSFGGY